MTITVTPWKEGYVISWRWDWGAGTKSRHHYFYPLETEHVS